MTNNQYQQKKNKKWIKYLVCTMLLCANSFLCFSQKKHDFDIFSKLNFPNLVLRISVQSENHGEVISIEEYFIYYKNYLDSNETIKSEMIVHIYTTYRNLLLTKYDIDTLITLDGTQIGTLLTFCNFMYKNKIPEKFYDRYILGWTYTYTMEIAGEKYTFTDRRHLSLAELLLDDNYYKEDIPSK